MRLDLSLLAEFNNEIISACIGVIQTSGDDNLVLEASLQFLQFALQSGERNYLGHANYLLISNTVELVNYDHPRDCPRLAPSSQVVAVVRLAFVHVDRLMYTIFLYTT